MLPSSLLAALSAAVTEQQSLVQLEFASLPLARLWQRPGPGQWSALECLEHLNRYSRYYLPALTAALARPGTAPAGIITYSWLGRQSIALMQPGNPSKQTTPRRMNPLGSNLGPATLTEFDQHQLRLLELLAQAATADLHQRDVPVEFCRLLKLRRGETLEFLVVHQQRHVQQAQRVLLNS